VHGECYFSSSPSKAKFLTAEEKVIALHRTLENKTGVMDEGTFKPSQMFEALRDPQAWLLALYIFSVNIPNGGTTAVSGFLIMAPLAYWHKIQFNSIIVAGFGFSPLNSLFVQIRGEAFQLLGLAFISVTSTYVKNVRVTCMISLVSLSLIGMIMVFTVSNEHKYTRLAGIWLLLFLPPIYPWL
jgi:hypothetical protein